MIFNSKWQIELVTFSYRDSLTLNWKVQSSADMAEVRFIGGYWAKRYWSNGDHQLIFQMRTPVTSSLLHGWKVLSWKPVPKVRERYGAAFKAALAKKIHVRYIIIGLAKMWRPVQYLISCNSSFFVHQADPQILSELNTHVKMGGWNRLLSNRNFEHKCETIVLRCW